MLIEKKLFYLTAIIFSGVLSWFSFFSIIFFTNPQSAGLLGFAVLYTSLAIGLAGLSLFLCQIIKQKKK